MNPSSAPASAPAATCRYLALIPHPSRPQVVLQFRDDLWYLPQWDDAEPRSWQSVEHINRAVQEHFGLAATTLRCFAREAEMGALGIARVYEMENRNAAWTPRGRDRWVGREMLATLPLGIPEQREILERWFAEAEPEQMARRRPWMRRGWLDATTNWIRNQFRQRGITFERVEQVRISEQACLLRVFTDAGTYYFRAVVAMPPYEAALTATLATWLPGRFPQIVAHDEVHHWLLMDDFGGAALEGERDIARWQRAARRFSEIQIGLALRKEELLALGCPEHALPALAAQLADLLAGEHATPPKALAGLSDEQRAALRALLPELQSACIALQQIDLPATLEHGDLAASNIIQRDDDFAFIDWSSSAVAHPFFSLLALLDAARDTFPAIPDAPQQIRDAYLSTWALYRPLEDLRAAFEMAQALGPFHFAIAHQRPIALR